MQSILPSGYGVPPGSPTETLLTALGRHGQRQAHIHLFVSGDGHCKLTTQIYIACDPPINDNIAFATHEGIVPDIIDHTDADSISANNLAGPLAEIGFDIHLTALVDGVDNHMNDQRRRASA